MICANKLESQNFVAGRLYTQSFGAYHVTVPTREKEIDCPHLAATANPGPTHKVTSGPEAASKLHSDNW